MSAQVTNEKKRIVIKVVVAIVSILVVAACTVLVLSLLKANPSTNQVVDPLRANVDEKVTFEKGNTAQFGYFEVTINTVTRNYTPTEALLPVQRGYQFLLLNITAKNTDDEPHLITDFDLAVLYKETVLTSSLFGRVEPVFASGGVEPGASVTGNILYEVPPDASDLSLYYNTQIYDYDQEKLKKIEHILPF